MSNLNKKLDYVNDEELKSISAVLEEQIVFLTMVLKKGLGFSNPISMGFILRVTRVSESSFENNDIIEAYGFKFSTPLDLCFSELDNTNKRKYKELMIKKEFMIGAINHMINLTTGTTLEALLQVAKVDVHKYPEDRQNDTYDRIPYTA